MHNMKNQRRPTLLLWVLIFVVVCGLYRDQTKSDHPLFSLLDFHRKFSIGRRDELDAALAVPKKNNTIIIAMANKAYVESDQKPMLDIFLDSFWFGIGTRDLIHHLLVVTVDKTSYDRCKFLRLHCYNLETNFSVDEKVYMSNDFINMMWRRTHLLREVLRRGHNFIFTDTDVLWLQDPFEQLSESEDIDLQISTDRFNGDQWSENNPINTGFYMVRSNKKSIALFDMWYAGKGVSTGQKEQDVLSSMMQQGVSKRLGVTVRFLDTRYFSGFCQDSKDFRAVTTVHANCCRTISAKVVDLMSVLHDWRRFRESSINENSTLEWSAHKACSDSWK